MDIGVKIRKLREQNRLSQPELSQRLGISQGTLCNIESGDTKKIDFLLMDKICKEFEVDFEYFVNEKQENHVKNNKGAIAYKIDTINNLPEKLIEQYEERIKELKEIISELRSRN